MASDKQELKKEIGELKASLKTCEATLKLATKQSLDYRTAIMCIDEKKEKIALAEKKMKNLKSKSRMSLEACEVCGEEVDAEDSV